MLALALVLVLAHAHTRFARRQSVTTAIVTAHAAACTAALASATLVGTTISTTTHAVAAAAAAFTTASVPATSFPTALTVQSGRAFGHKANTFETFRSSRLYLKTSSDLPDVSRENIARSPNHRLASRWFGD